MEIKIVAGIKHQSRPQERGASIIEILIVISIIVILGALAVPQMMSARRLLRSTAITRQVLTQLRLVRQEAMSQRQAITLQYDDVNKQIVVIDHNAVGRALLNDVNYPNTPGSTRLRTIPLSDSGLPAGEISYGIAPGAPNNALGDSTTLTPLPANGLINITFQPDGSVVNGAGNLVNYAFYFYNNKASKETASAISVLGSGGRVKIWRYDRNANSYME